MTQVVTRPPRTADRLGRALLGRLYDAVCDGEDEFLSWPAWGSASSSGELGDGAAPDQRLRQASAVAELVDVAPPGGTRLSAVYGEILRGCRVVRGTLSDEEKLKVDKFRDLLRTHTLVTDPETGAEREVTDDGPMLRAYQHKLAAYRHAVLRRNLGKDADGAGVDAAMQDWVACGYRNEVDQVTAYLDRIGRRDLTLWRRQLVEMYEQAQIGGDGVPLHYSTLVPGEFATGAGWTEFSFRDDDARTGGNEPPPWRTGAEQLDFTLAPLDGLALTVELTPVVIARPWFFPEFLGNRGWTLDGEPVCDGGDPPRGRLVGYPMLAVFARNLRIDSAKLAAACGRPGLSWGPFRLDGATVASASVTVPGLQLVGFVNQRLGRTPDPLPELDAERFV